MYPFHWNERRIAMKTFIIYDSWYGNTEKIARAIGDGLASEVKVMRVGEVNPSELKTCDLLIVGSPVHGGRATPELESFIKKLPAYYLEGISAAAFDTRFEIEDQGLGIRLLMNVIRYAADRIAKSLVKKGGVLVANPEGFIVEEKEGPLKQGELERATKWATQLSLAKEVPSTTRS
jgi:flavodoxin I